MQIVNLSPKIKQSAHYHHLINREPVGAAVAIVSVTVEVDRESESVSILIVVSIGSSDEDGLAIDIGVAIDTGVAMDIEVAIEVGLAEEELAEERVALAGVAEEAATDEVDVKAI